MRSVFRALPRLHTRPAAAFVGPRFLSSSTSSSSTTFGSTDFLRNVVLPSNRPDASNGADAAKRKRRSRADRVGGSAPAAEEVTSPAASEESRAVATSAFPGLVSAFTAK